MGLQEIVDHIAQVVGRSALVEDRKQRAVVYSPQSDEIDEVRRTTILQRHAGPEVSSWLRTLGVNQARGPIRTPPNDSLRMLPRLCIPIWKSDLPLGYLWFIDAPGAMTAKDVDLASGLGDRLAEEWYRWRLKQDQATSRNSVSVRDLLLGSGDAIYRAADELTDDGYFSTGAQVSALTVRPAIGAEEPSEELRDRLERTIRTATRGIGATSCLWLVRPDHAVLLMAAPDEAGHPGAVDAMAGRLVEAADRYVGGLDGVSSVVVGVGAARAALDQAQDSYLDASRAAQIGVSFQLPDRVVHWDRLGVYRGLYAIANLGVQPSDMQSGFDRLIGEKDGPALLDTLECYLNLGGHVQGAAAQLNLHRTSLYYRLDRIQRIVGVDLSNGIERLGLHLAIMLARMKQGVPRNEGPGR